MIKIRKFGVGQMVEFVRSGIDPRHEPRGAFSIVHCLPHSGAFHRYRIRSDADGHERIAREERLAAARYSL